MSDIPFRFKNRISKVTGFVPASTGLSDGEFFVQQADKAIIFKDIDGNLVQIKNLQTGSFVTTGQTGAFGGGGSIDTGTLVGANQTGAFITTGQTGAFGVNTGTLVGANQTGVFITTGQTGAFAAAALTGIFITTGQTGAFGGAGGSSSSGPLFQAAPASGTYCGNPIIVNADSYLQTGNLISGSSCSLILQGRNNCILDGCNSTILAGFYSCVNSSCDVVAIGMSKLSYVSESFFIGTNNCSIGSYDATVIGKNNCLNYGYSNIVIGYCNSVDNGFNSYVIGTNNIKNSNSSNIYIFGRGIDLSSGDSPCTLYVNNLCVYDGVIYGNGSGITGLNIDVSSFVTTGQTGSFGNLKLEENNSLKLNSSTSDGQSCRNFVMSDTYGTICSGSHTNFIFGSYMNVISGGSSSKNLIFGGSNNKIAEGVTDTATFGGDGFSITNSNTVYSQNFCAVTGKFFGDGSALTGLATGSFITTGQTGAFGGSVNTGSFVTTGQTGTLVGTNQTGNFLTLSNFQNFSSLETDPPSLATSNHFTILNGCSGTIYLACYVTILNGKWNAIQSSECASILNGCANGITNSTGVLVGNGRSNIIYNSYNSSILNGSGNCIGTAASGACYSTIINGCCSKIGMLVGNSMIVGNFNCISDSKNSVYIFGSNITGSADNTTYVNNICSNAKYYGDGSALTGLATGSFITTGQTGAFGGSVNTGSFVATGQTGVFITTGQTGAFVATGRTGAFITTGQTGVFALAANTGAFITTGQTGVFALSANTGTFITTGQTGAFVATGRTGAFITTGQTGVFALSANTGAFVTTGQTGVFALSANTGAFVTTGQTGVFALSANTGAFVTTGQTGTLCVNNLCVAGGYLSVGGIEENFVTCATGASGLINFDVCPAATMYYICNATANFGLNLRSNSSTTINSIVETGKTLTVTFLNTNGSTAYALTGVSIDGSGRSIKWLNGTGSFPAGNTGSIDNYSITAVKTGNNLYTVFGSQGRFV